MNERMKAYHDVWYDIIEDPYRPSYHFCGPFGFATPFDPNGLLFWNGRYHMFYIYQDDEDRHCWGHASTVDFVHWKPHKPALKPDSPQSGSRIYSGNVFLSKEGIPTAAYCGYDLGVCIAESRHCDLDVWELCEDNPVIPIPDPQQRHYSQYNLYDANVWIEGDSYKNLVGGIVRVEEEMYDTAYLYTSEDLRHWNFQGEFYRPQPGWTHKNEDCACPDFFSLGGRHVLVCISHLYGARAYIGDYRNGCFLPDHHYRINTPGGCLFAPESFLDQKGRRIMMIWATDSHLKEDALTKYSTCMAIPRVLSLRNGTHLAAEPIEEIRALSYDYHFLEGNAIPEGPLLPKEFSGRAKRYRVELKHKAAGCSGIKLFCSVDGTEETSVFVRWGDHSLNIDFSKSRMDPIPYVGTDSVILLDEDWAVESRQQITCQTRELNDVSNRDITLEIYTDGSILEVFADDGTAMAQRVYPAGKSSIHCALIGDGEDFGKLETWAMDTAR